MKKTTLLLLLLLSVTLGAKADVEWTIWEGSVTKGNVQGKSKLDFSLLEVGDIIYVYGTGELSKAIVRISGNDWSTWTQIQSYAPAVDASEGYYHVVTEDFLTNFNYSSDDTKCWAVSNWDSGNITKVTIRKAKSAIKTILSADTKTDDVFEYTINASDFSNLVVGDYFRLSTSQRGEVGGKDYKIEFKESEGDWTTYTTLWGPTHDAIWKVENLTISEKNIKDHNLYIRGELYNSNGVSLYHPINSFKIGSIGYATFSASQQVTAPNSVTAYKGTVSGNKLVLSPFADNVIPANTGAVIAGDEGAVLEFTASSVSTSETSELLACTSATDVSTLAETGYGLYVLYAGTAESETGLELSTLLSGISDWGGKVTVSGSEPYTAEWTSESTSSSMGRWLGSDWSSYDKLRLVFTNNTVAETVHFGLSYNGQENSENTGADLAAGELTVDIPLNENASYKSAMGNFSFNSNAKSGSLTFESAALIDNDGSTVAEFRKTTSGTLAANKAYLKLPSGTAARLNLIIDDEQPTAISSVENKPAINDNRFFNLNGQQVSNPGKGLYIVNGKKVMIK